MSDSLEERITRLEAEVRVARDKQEIYDQIMRYSRGVDRCNQDLIQSTYPTYPAAGVVAYSLKNTMTMMHFVGNCLIEVDGDDAESETYFVSYHRIDRDGVEHLRMRGARYLHLWKRVDGRWITTDREMLDEWNSIQEVTERDPGSERWTFGQRSEDDGAFQIRDYLVSTRERREANYARLSKMATQ
jgi:hypothetical protein